MVAAAASVVDVSRGAPPAPVAVLAAAPVVVACVEPVTAVAEFVTPATVEPVFGWFELSDVLVLAPSVSLVSFVGAELLHPSVMRTRTGMRSSLRACMMRTKVLVPVKLFENVASCGSSSIFQLGRARHLRQGSRPKVVAEA